MRALWDEGTQERLVPEMQTRARLYELLRYDAHAEVDAAAYGGREDDG